MERHRRRHQLPLAVAALLVAAASAAIAFRALPRSGSEGCQEAGAPVLDRLESRAGLSSTSRLEISQLPLAEEAAQRLEVYRTEGACSLDCAGYLDLYGNAWGCIVSGLGWADVVVIEDAGDGTCAVRTVHIGSGT